MFVHQTTYQAYIFSGEEKVSNVCEVQSKQHSKE